MKLTLHWNEGLIFKEKRPIGFFVKNDLSVCNYELNQARLKFKPIPSDKREVAILDPNYNTIGKIKYPTWFSNAKIILEGIEFELKPVNFLKRKWTLFAKQNELMTFNKGIFNTGEVNSVFNNEELILASLFVLNKGN